MEGRLQHLLLKRRCRDGLRSGRSLLSGSALLCVCGSGPLAAILLTLLPAAAALAADTDLNLEPLAVREPPRREVKVDDIDTEDWEVGVYGGALSVEDFGSNAVAGARIAYHVTENLFVEGTYGRTTLGETSFERLSGGARILTDSERKMTYYDVSVGYNLFPGEAFFGGRWAFKGSLYLLAGAGSTSFGGDDRFTVTGGVGYRLVTTDWLAFHLDVRDHVFQSDLLGTRDTRHNIELAGGVTVFF